MNECYVPASNQCPLRFEGEKKTWNKEDVMKTIVSALIALAVLAGVAAPAGAGLDAKKFFAQLDRSRF